MKVFTRALPVLGLVLFISAAAAAEPAEVKLDIKQQPTRTALAAFSNQSGIQVVFPSDEVADDLMSPAIAGRFAPQVALDRLLMNTGLRYQYVNDRTVAIRLATSPEMQAERQASDRALGAGQAESREPEGTAPLRTTIQTEGGAKNRAGIEEVVVTAQKREERLIDTPQSVTVLSGAALTKLAAVQFRDFANTVPGLTFTTNRAGSTQINLRGITSGVDLASAVAVYLDDVPYGSSSSFASGAQSALDPALFDVERIEVLRGPQGTLYGAASMGGLIKYVSKRPDPQTFGADVRAGISKTEAGGVGFDAAVVVNAPVVADRLGLRLTAFKSRDGGYVDNIVQGRADVNQAGIQGGRVDLLFEPTQALSIRISGFLQDTNSDGQATADYTTAGIEDAGELTQRRRYAEPFDQRFRLASGTVSYDMGFAALTSITSYQRLRSDEWVDSSAQLLGFLTAAPPAGLGRSYSAIGGLQSLSLDKFSQEFRLASLGDQNLEWLIGAVYSHEDAKKLQVYDPRDLTGAPAANDILNLLIGSKYEDIAAFLNLTYHFTDRFDVSLGIRHARNEQIVSQIGSGLFGANRPTRSADENVNTYLANARYHVSDHATVYARYATGYRPGGPNIVLNSPTTGLPVAQPTYDADHLKSYELGFKAQTGSGAAGIDLAAYYIDWTDIQISALRGGPPPVGVRTNAGRASVRGAELSMYARPREAFTVSSALALVDAELAESAPDLGGADGEQLPNVPEFSATMTADYVLPIANLRPSIGATVRHVSNRKQQFGPTGYRLPRYTVLDLRTDMTLGSVDLQFYIHNATDEVGQFSEFHFPGTTIARVAIQQPRTFGIMAIARF